MKSLLTALLFILLSQASDARADMASTLAERFAESDIRFARGRTNAPFLPLAFASMTVYGDTELDPGADGEPRVFDQYTVSQAAVLPILLTEKDALFIGEYFSWSDFTAKGQQSRSFDVLSFGLPMGWLRQTRPDWQLAAFLMPLGHRTSFPGADWSWEYMGGLFTRYVASDDLWWVFGLFGNTGPGFDYYLPYVGASWLINDQWTLSAVMPWPSISWAPNSETLLRLGVSPSGASWALSGSGDEISMDLGGWDLGLSFEKRVAGNFWAYARTGISGMRGLTFDSHGFESPDLSSDSAWFVGVGVNFRPSP